MGAGRDKVYLTPILKYLEDDHEDKKEESFPNKSD
jgi:hypothetical protein